MTDRNAVAEESTRQARSIITAVLMGDHDAAVAVVRSLPTVAEEGVVSQQTVLSALGGVAAGILQSLAWEREMDAQEMWRGSIEDSLLNGGI